MRSQIFDRSTAEVAGDTRFVLQNPRMLKVTLGPDVLATKGSMVAYQGQAEFRHEGAGSVGKLLKKMLTSEDNPLMRVSGNAEVFFARHAEEIFLVALEDDGLSVNGSSLLAFDATLNWDIRRVQGAGMFAGGLFNTLIQGRGELALTTDGTPVLLDCSGPPTYADLQAAVAWSANLVPEVVSSMKMSSLLRGGSGESLQYRFQGPGFVIVQPSEGPVVPPHSHGSTG